MLVFDDARHFHFLLIIVAVSVRCLVCEYDRLGVSPSDELDKSVFEKVLFVPMDIVQKFTERGVFLDPKFDGRLIHCQLLAG
jgi:hypothetical protein